jgi:hypothetical protein
MSALVESVTGKVPVRNQLGRVLDLVNLNPRRKKLDQVKKESEQNLFEIML